MEEQVADSPEYRAEQLLRARVEANGSEVETIRVVQKGRQAYLATVTLAGSDEVRHAVVTSEELANT